MAKYYNTDCLEWLRDDWKCTVVRAAMGVESGGYLTNPIVEKNKIIEVFHDSEIALSNMNQLGESKTIVKKSKSEIFH